MSGSILFQSQLRNQYGHELEYSEPYKGFLGSYPAEIYNPSGLYQIIDKVRSLNLTVKHAEFRYVDDKMQAFLPDVPVDVVSSTCGRRGGMIQLIFINQKALDIFKQAFNVSPVPAHLISQPVLAEKPEQNELKSKHEWLQGSPVLNKRLLFKQMVLSENWKSRSVKQQRTLLN